jgi:hypothetical protein
MNHRLNLTGQKFGRLTALYSSFSNDKGHVLWACACDCGSRITTLIPAHTLKAGKKNFCQFCKNSSITTHGYSHTKIYGVYHKAKERCCKPTCKDFKDYGGRGISMCDEWMNSPVAFITWALENGYREGLSLDRIDNDKGYSPDNCRFVNYFIQANNRSTNRQVILNGITDTIANHAKRLNVKRTTLVSRLKAARL